MERVCNVHHWSAGVSLLCALEATAGSHLALQTVDNSFPHPPDSPDHRWEYLPIMLELAELVTTPSSVLVNLPPYFLEPLNINHPAEGM